MGTTQQEREAEADIIGSDIIGLRKSKPANILKRQITAPSYSICTRALTFPECSQAPSLLSRLPGGGAAAEAASAAAAAAATLEEEEGGKVARVNSPPSPLPEKEEEEMLLQELYKKFKEAHVNLSLAEEEEDEVALGKGEKKLEDPEVAKKVAARSEEWGAGMGEGKEAQVIVGETSGTNSVYASVYAQEKVKAQLPQAIKKKQDESPHSGLSEGGGGGGEGADMADMTDMRVERLPWVRRFEQQGVLDGVLGRLESEGAEHVLNQGGGGVLLDLDLCSIYGQDGNSIPLAFQMCAGLLAVYYIYLIYVYNSHCF